MASVVRLNPKDEINSVEFMLPVGQRRDVRSYALGLAPGVKPKRVGMLANGFPGADNFLLRQEAALREFWPDAEFIHEVKASAKQLNIGIREPLLNKMVEACDVVVIAWGHCGSCTSGVTRDAIAFESRGVPTVTLVCDVFWDYSHWLGDAMTLRGIPKVQIPFPLSGTSAENQDRWAQKIAPEIVEKMTVS
jgi:hypothetical protein